VAFVEVAMNRGNNGLDWDTHQNNFNEVKSLSAELDAGWATLKASVAGMAQTMLGTPAPAAPPR
jgi:hypothetical protein